MRLGSCSHKAQHMQYALKEAKSLLNWFQMCKDKWKSTDHTLLHCTTAESLWKLFREANIA